eukprot:358582-Chlamydomonas_euryale.AAC.18
MSGGVAGAMHMHMQRWHRNRIPVAECPSHMTFSPLNARRWKGLCVTGPPTLPLHAAADATASASARGQFLRAEGCQLGRQGRRRLWHAAMAMAEPLIELLAFDRAANKAILRVGGPRRARSNLRRNFQTYTSNCRKTGGKGRRTYATTPCMSIVPHHRATPSCPAGTARVPRPSPATGFVSRAGRVQARTALARRRGDDGAGGTTPACCYSAAKPR